MLFHHHHLIPNFMSTILLQSNWGTYVQAHVNQSGYALFADAENLEQALKLDYATVGGFPKSDEIHIEFQMAGSSDELYVTLNEKRVVLQTGLPEGRPFEVLWLSPDTIALRGANGKFVSSQTGDSRELQANRKAVGSWETFKVIVQE